MVHLDDQGYFGASVPIPTTVTAAWHLAVTAPPHICVLPCSLKSAGSQSLSVHLKKLGGPDPAVGYPLLTPELDSHQTAVFESHDTRTMCS